jgi:hypothetical protein
MNSFPSIWSQRLPHSFPQQREIIIFLRSLWEGGTVLLGNSNRGVSNVTITLEGNGVANATYRDSLTRNVGTNTEMKIGLNS